jgi:hypothetical protein
MAVKTKYKIYKFDFTFSKSRASEEKQHKVRWERAQELTKFKHKLIDELNDEDFNALVKYTDWAKPLGIEFVEYKSPRNHYVSDRFEIGFDMLHTKFGMKAEYHWSSLYFFVPEDATVMIEFFEKNKPTWVTNVSKI